MSKKPNGYWTYEKCLEVVKKCNNRSELHKNYGGAYNVIKNNNWDMLDIYHPIVTWTYEKCKKEALKYNYKKDMWLKSQYSIAYINKNKWYELLSHMLDIGSRDKRMIYSYEFSDNSCYVGLTYDINNRHNRHLNDLNSPVYKKINENISYNLTHKTDYIDRQLASKMEGIILDKYYDDNWKILNIKKTGGLGGNILKYDYDYCINVANKYNSKKDFIKNEKTLYYNIVSNGYLDKLYKELNWTKKELNWTYDKCYEISSKYMDLKTFRLAEKNCYKFIYKNGWLDELTNHMKRLKK